MPIYEYECTACHNVIEAFQRMTEDPLCTCPDCSGSLKKLVSMSSFKLKGGGWYADGYSTSSTCSESAGKSNGKGNGKGKGGQEKSDKSSAAASKKSDPAKTSPSKKSSAAAA